MIRCKSCGSENNDNLAFCINCGSEKSSSQASVSSSPTPVSPTQDIVSSSKVACPHCQKLNSFYLTFCDHCGKNMKYDDYNQKKFLSHEEMRLTGIGGWLIFPTISFFLAVLGGVGIAIDAAVAQPLLVESVPDIFIQFLNLAIVFGVLCSIVFIILLVLLFKKKKIFPKIFIGLCILSCLLAVVSAICSYSLGEYSVNMLCYAIIVSVLGNALWILYFLLSKRVKYTFTK